MNNRFVNQFFNLLHGGKPESETLADFVVERCWETDQSVMASRLHALESFDVSERLWQIDAPPSFWPVPVTSSCRTPTKKRWQSRFPGPASDQSTKAGTSPS